MFKKLLPLVAAFPLLLVAFCGLTLAALYGCDDQSISAQLRQGFRQGVLPNIEHATSAYGHDDHEYDVFSECVGLGLNLGNVDQSWLYRLAASPYVGPQDSSQPATAGKGAPCHDLDRAVASGRAEAGLPYFRFWHGYQIYIRAVLSLASVAMLHKLNAVLLFGSLIYLAYVFSRRFGPGAFAALLVPLALATDILSAPPITVHSISLSWCFFSAALVAHMRDKSPRLTANIRMAVFCSGAIFNFLSMLFNPPLAPALMAFTMLAYSSPEEQPPRKWAGEIDALETVGLWFLGFGLTWIAKWLLAVVVLDPSTVAASLSSAAQGEHYDAFHNAQVHTPFAPTLVTLFWSANLPLTILASWFATLLILAKQFGRTASSALNLRGFFRLQLPLLIVVAWSETFRVHSVEHAGYVMRNLVLFAILPLLAALLVTRRGPGPEKAEGNPKS
jgi:hypothetical protein